MNVTVPDPNDVFRVMESQGMTQNVMECHGKKKLWLLVSNIICHEKEGCAAPVSLLLEEPELTGIIGDRKPRRAESRTLQRESEAAEDRLKSVRLSKLHRGFQQIRKLIVF